MATLMEHHPLDARSAPVLHKDNETPVEQHHYLLSVSDLRALPSLQKLLLGCPGRPFTVRPHAGDLAVEINAVDIVAASLAHGEESADLLTAAENWARAHSQTAIERFSISLSLTSTISTTSSSTRHDLTESLRRSELREIFPTLDRCIRAWRNGQPESYQTPRDTLHLRSSGWRDGAGRGIDRYLLEGLWRANRYKPPSGRGPAMEDPVKAKTIDDRLPSRDYNFYYLVFKKGLVLDEDHLRALQDLHQHLVAGDEPGSGAGMLVHGKNAVSAVHTKELLDGDRANRAAAAQMASPAPAGPGSASSDPEPHPIGMTL